jgi:hypothetical protein
VEVDEAKGIRNGSQSIITPLSGASPHEKMAHSEASPLLYSRNCFRLQDQVSTPGYETQGAILASFLENIGRQNASFLRHICIAFPAFDDYHLGNVTLQEDSIHTLELIRDNCTNIATLETSLRTTSAMEFTIAALDSPRTAAEVLALVDARFKAILSLREVIVNVYDEPPSDDLRRKIRAADGQLRLQNWKNRTTVDFLITTTTLRLTTTMPR